MGSGTKVFVAFGVGGETPPKQAIALLWLVPLGLVVKPHTLLTQLLLLFACGASIASATPGYFREESLIRRAKRTIHKKGTHERSKGFPHTHTNYKGFCCRRQISRNSSSEMENTYTLVVVSLLTSYLILSP